MSIRFRAVSRGRHTVAGAVAVAGCLLLTACSDNGGTQQPPTQAGQTSGTPATTGPTTGQPTTTATDPGGTGSQPTGPAGEDLGQPVATRTVNVPSQNDPGPAKLELYQPRRSDTIVHLHLRITPIGGRRYLAFEFSDQTKASSTTQANGIRLIDTKNRKAYLVAHDGQGNCFCTKLPGFFESALLVSATFGAPPADVQSVDVQVPVFGVFRNVQIG